MKKNVWIFNHYATNMYRNKGGRHFYFAKKLKKSGYNPVIFCANTIHNSDERFIDDNETKNSGNKNKFIIKEKDGILFVFIDTVPSFKNNVKRIMNMYLFYYNLLKSYNKILKEIGYPDIIYASSVHPLTLVAGIKISKRLHIPCVSEIRDLWPEAIFQFTRIKQNSILGKLLISGEHWIYKKSDSLIFTKEGDTDYLKEKNWFTYQGGDIDFSKCNYINNGVELDTFNKNIKNNTLDDVELNSDKFNVVYTGAIRPVNNISKIVEIAYLLKDHTDIQFLIYGTGNDVERIEALINKLELDNVKLKGRVEKKYIPYILNNSDLNLLNYSQDKYNWTRGNSSNKLFEYFASGKPVIATIEMGYSPIKKYNCGFEIKGDNNNEIVASKILDIKNLYDSDIDAYNELCERAVKASKEFDYNALTQKLIRVLENTNRS